MSSSKYSGASRRHKAAGLKIGQRFNRYVVIGEPTTKTNAKGGTDFFYPCRCDCGTERLVKYRLLVGPNGSISCGCYRNERNHECFTRHGGTGTKLYNIHKQIIRRCENPKCVAYPDYGGRGIRICNEWRNDYSAFRDFAYANGYKEGLSTDRIDTDGNYEPSNVRFVPISEQAGNTRRSIWLTIFGERKTQREWTRDPRCQVNHVNFRARIKMGWSLEQALLTPPHQKREPSDQPSEPRKNSAPIYYGRFARITDFSTEELFVELERRGVKVNSVPKPHLRKLVDP